MLRPGYEPIITVRRPLDGTHANTYGKYGSGLINTSAQVGDSRFPATVVTTESLGDDWDAAFLIRKPTGAERKAAGGHPTPKPMDLMRHLVDIFVPPGGVVLDPFAGSGTTLVAATLEGVRSIGIELIPEYLPIIKARTDWAVREAAMAIHSELLLAA